MRITTMLALSALSLAAATPAIAQDAMMKDGMKYGMKSGSMMKMSPADTRKMKSCNAVSHAMMMKQAGCAKMMKMHPEMMKQDSMMKGH